MSRRPTPPPHPCPTEVDGYTLTSVPSPFACRIHCAPPVQITESNDDAASWTPSSVFSFERNGDQSHDIFRYTQHLKQPARASWSTAEEAAGTFCVSDATAPLPPRFVGSGRPPATASNNATGGVFCMAPAGEGGLSCVREVRSDEAVKIKYFWLMSSVLPHKCEYETISSSFNDPTQRKVDRLER